MSKLDREPIQVNNVDDDAPKTPELKPGSLLRSPETKREGEDPPQLYHITKKIFESYDNEKTRSYVIGAGGLAAVLLLWYAKIVFSSTDKWFHLFALAVVFFALVQVEKFLESNEELNNKIEDMLQQAKVNDQVDETSEVEETSSAGENLDDDVF